MGKYPSQLYQNDWELPQPSAWLHKMRTLTEEEKLAVLVSRRSAKLEKLEKEKIPNADDYEGDDETDHRGNEGDETDHCGNEGDETDHCGNEGNETDHCGNEGDETDHRDYEGDEIDHHDYEGNETDHQNTEPPVQVVPPRVQFSADEIRRLRHERSLIPRHRHHALPCCRRCIRPERTLYERTNERSIGRRCNDHQTHFHPNYYSRFLDRL